jgi:hypothetical protein
MISDSFIRIGKFAVEGEEEGFCMFFFSVHGGG